MNNKDIRWIQRLSNFTRALSQLEQAVYFWMQMIKSRNKTSHTYNEETANEIASEIIHAYLPLFKKFQSKMESLRSGESGSINA